MEHAEAFDLGADAAPADRLEQLQAQAAESIELMSQIEAAEESLKNLKSRLHLLRTKLIPDTMTSGAMSEATILGKRIVLNDFVSGSLPKEDKARAKAVAWLTANDGGGLIKTEVTVSFGRSQHNEAVDLAEKLKKDGHVVERSENVHPQTLAKFARDRLAEGKPIDFETLGLYTGKVADFKEPKKK